jgi:hemerythrin superfamily protein
MDEVLMPTELPNLIEKLKMDHQTIRDLFDRFQQADDRARQGIAERALVELEIHSNVEEDLIYPAIRRAEN